MSLRSSLRPLLGMERLVAVMVLTADGLPVEMFGYGLRADQLAAELASVGEAARRSFRALGLGEPARQSFELAGHEVTVFPVAGHYLAVVLGGRRAGDELGRLAEGALPNIEQALKGEA